MSDFVNVIAGGDLRASLVALRDRLAGELEPGEHLTGCDCECDHPVAGDPRAVAVLSKELARLLVQIDKLPGGEEKSNLDLIAESIPSDELAPRRARRQPGAAASPRS